ncbi:hypothetical protein SISSUDRAFT_627930 [Sistotremastrum suecicum HHB10207 ss-3]|uniref:DUF6534 domain-containing protein n=1 Tax=Sistotremastrum suecicum HHB10207 ss-3 TaxID=1314776 RepID=A0A166EFN0_9AGAM|nr:hypothetical protein SISSUDRAFT_627930 [Sistotremastrum suecicum HHB10207 ss-3]
MLVEFICHAFFIAKIWKLSKRNWVVCGSISVLEIARLATKSVLSVRLFTVSYWAEFGIVLKTCITLPLVLGVCTDIAITCCLCYYLRKCRTGYQRTDNLISHLLYYTINNGILTTAGDIVILGLFLGIPDNLAYLAVFEVISKLYATAILTSLNTRPLLRAQHQAGGLELYRNHLLSPLTPASATKTSLNSAGCASNMSPTFDVIRSGGSRNGETEVKVSVTWVERSYHRSLFTLLSTVREYPFSMF